MKSIKYILFNNPIARGAYKFKQYIDLGTSQVSWISGKLPEIVSWGVLLNWAGWDFNKSQAAIFVIGVMIGLFLFGYAWKKLGLYDTEVYINANINPVTKELLEAARKINGGKNGRRNKTN